MREFIMNYPTVGTSALQASADPIAHASAVIISFPGSTSRKTRSADKGFGMPYVRQSDDSFKSPYITSYQSQQTPFHGIGYQVVRITETLYYGEVRGKAFNASKVEGIAAFSLFAILIFLSVIISI